jgi:isopentenyl diphosphate isomerase/L-lactate dehydrogenase-like FMN-dependent dehydrogenase
MTDKPPTDAPLAVADFEAMAREMMSAVAGLPGRSGPAVDFEILSSFIDGNETLRRTPLAFDAIALRPRVLSGAASADLSVTVLGQQLDVPFMLAPSGYHTRVHPDGELATARAAATAGTVMALATNAGFSMEEVAAAAPGPKWLQTYFYRDRDHTVELVRRAEDAGFVAICMTIDGHWPAKRQLAKRGDRRGGSGSGVGPAGERLPLRVLQDPATTWADPAATWSDLEWLKTQTDLPLICKGVMTAQDANLCVAHGADALIVSNHGARLGNTLASIEVLPEVAAAVGGHIEVFMDGGIRRGADVVRALALGARAVLMGRPLFWGLACGGEDGLLDLLDLLSEEIEMTMIHCGCPDIASIDSSVIAPAVPLGP